MNHFIHPAGQRIVFIGLFAYLILYLAALQAVAYNHYFIYTIGLTGLFLLSFLLLFFRNPKREVIPNSKLVFAPADGRIVAIEEVFEKEYLSQNCLKVSIFMSITNIHVNRYSVSGTIRYSKYHPGRYFIASYPKSSELNEHHSTAIETDEGILVMIKQIAGAVARRVVCYAKNGKKVAQGDDLGFIKFGSRVDIFLPLKTEILIKMNEKVIGNRTVIARFNRY
ncbi:MAG: phosphatidylserine decarboxylase family protein [Bacteroidales bacterium]|nr:MAG: phosphatidylserine decarboxylase family protein [Bacteroidales bacterium]